jgi:hypothetical protein
MYLNESLSGVEPSGAEKIAIEGMSRPFHESYELKSDVPDRKAMRHAKS